MKILVTGSTGLLGQSLLPALSRQGDRGIRLLRDGKLSEPAALRWNPVSGETDLTAWDGIEAVVHLAGDGIADGRWNPEKKTRIKDTRVVGTRRLVNVLGRLKTPPKTLIAASAIGYYGNRGTESLTEDSSPGVGFLPDVCQAWEAASSEAEKLGIRVVQLRFGIILSGHGGALKKMLPPFRLGIGGKLGSGQQIMSWVSLPDAVGMIQYALKTNDLRGPVNAVSPSPVSNDEFTRALGRALHRPTLFPVPSFGARLLFGEMADALLLASTKVLPERLRKSGYPFQHRALDGALAAVLR